MRPHLIIFLIVFSALNTAQGENVYQEPQAFVANAFDGDIPEPSVLWMSGETRDTVEAILGHSYANLRVRYWQQDDRTAWILEEIGKKKPITTGLVVNSGKLARIKVLIYRESRGWEVREEFFTNQFKGATLTANHRLDRNIDGISGATLSVRALTKLARVALYLHDAVSE